MTRDHHSNVFTIGIGGAAGDGVRESGQSLGHLLCELGYEVYISNTYPSLIRGGHNFTRVSFSRDKMWCDHKKLDVLIALNEETIKMHLEELHSAPDHTPAVVFADSFDDEDRSRLGNNAIALPMSDSIKNLNASPITRNSVAIGASCYLMDLDFSIMQRILTDVFKDKQLEINMKLADIGYELLKKIDFRHPKIGSFKRSSDMAMKLRRNVGVSSINKLLDGNTAVAKGLIAAGLDFYIGYPMTPVTGLLHFLANKSKDSSIKVIQPESELSVINMALGMSYAGKRVAVGSATGGFMLMQEAFSLAGMAELPLAIIVGQRQAPATGVPTYSSQTDLRSIIHAGHGEFPRIVLLPGDHEEAFTAGIDALNLAWKYQIPVIVLMDKNLCEHSATCNINADIEIIERGKVSNALIKGDNEYARYSITADGISPMTFPGTREAVVKVTSYEHDEYGITTEDADLVKDMIDKRFRKEEIILKEFNEKETIKVYGNENSKNVVVFWGSTKGPVLEAAKYLEYPVKFLQILWAEPFDKIKVKGVLANAKKIINIECNHDAQMAMLIREKTGIVISNNILKYDSRPFDPIELADKINTICRT